MAIQTEYEYSLPKGYVDRDGNLHKQGTIRLANAADEILPLKDPRVKNNPAYLSIILLSRVITKLGTLEGEDINPGVIEGFFVEDLTFLQEFYRRINGGEDLTIMTKCPNCSGKVEVNLNLPGE